MSKGILYAVAANGAWGILPIFWKSLHDVPAGQILANRVVWTVVFLLVVIFVSRDWANFRAAITPKTVFSYGVAGILLGINWLGYIWGVNAGYIIEASLGYFINPLVSVMLGVIFLRETLPVRQWIPVALAAAGVVYLTVGYGSPPWLALLLAFTFGFYGLVKKTAPLGSLHGLTLETAAMFLPSLVYLVFVENEGIGVLGHAGITTHILLVMTGVVTALPLLLFAAGTRLNQLSTMGFLQYISPTLQFLIGIFLYGETFSPTRLIGFSIIWLALLIYSVGGVFNHRKVAAVR
jgi:chloramphenicol-sensitive protein RarD